MFTAILENNIKTILEKYHTLSLINNSTLKGTLRELIINELLVKILPSHYGITSGIIVDKWNKQSPQCDIIIYDKRKLPPIILESNNGIIPIDSVHRVIEIKSNLTRESVEQSITLAWSLSPKNEEGLKVAKAGNLKDGQTNYPLVGCFSFKSAIANVDKFANEYITTAKIKPAPNVIFCALGQGLFSKDNEETYHHRKIPLDDVQLLRLFIGMFLHFIEEEADSRSKFSLLEWLM